MPGGGEILVILILVLLLFGPDKLPGLARQLGRGVRELNRVKSNFSEQFNLLDDEEEKPRRSTSSTRNDALPHAASTSDDDGDWESYAARQSTSEDARDEDDRAEDFSNSVDDDWRNCAEEPRALEQNSVDEAAALQKNELGATFSDDGHAHLPAAPRAIARGAAPNRVQASDESNAEASANASAQN